MKLRFLLGFVANLPELRGVDLDSPDIVPLRAAIVQQKGLLSAIYRDWYARLGAVDISTSEGRTVEIGSGPGFLRDFIPGLISSDLVATRSMDVVFSCESIPFAPSSLSTLFLVNVFHHIQHPAKFLREAERCLRPGGRVVMIEPWNTPWSRLIWTRLHHEAFEPNAPWDLPVNTPLSAANGALPWIVFERDLEVFNATFPKLRMTGIQPFMPVTYLLSGGVSMRAFAPGFMYPPLRRLEALFDRQGLFAQIELTRIE